MYYMQNIQKSKNTVLILNISITNFLIFAFYTRAAKNLIFAFYTLAASLEVVLHVAEARTHEAEAMTHKAEVKTQKAEAKVRP